MIPKTQGWDESVNQAPRRFVEAISATDNASGLIAGVGLIDDDSALPQMTVEWISSIELENLAVAHRDVSEAAVIGVRHEQWGERPLLIVVPNEGAIPEKMSILGLFKGQVADWWIPDDLVVVDEIPHTATGKVSKVTLREQFVDYHLDETQKR